VVTETFDNAKRQDSNEKRAKHKLQGDGRYRIDNYDEGPAFSSFLPGIAGPDGVPLWCMYVNRAQAVVSFGVANKDNAIAEFLPATWAYQLVGVQGFRTLCKIDNRYYEPFQKDLASRIYDYSRTMWIEPDNLRLAETNHTLGLSFNVDYFCPVNQPVGSLVRLLTITNNSDESKRINVLDGLALILPAGFTDHGLKSMRHITEAYASVRLICQKVPFYSAKVEAHDKVEVTKVTRGNFYAAWVSGDGKLIPTEPLVDSHVVFGLGNDLITPRRFIAAEALDRQAQVWENRLPCALAPVETTLEPAQSVTVVAIIGSSPSEDMAVRYLSAFSNVQDIESLRKQSHQLVESLTLPAFTVSQMPALDGYARQNYLDNILRGGIPLLLPSKSGPTLLHLYSRRHGDLERDYNYFVLLPHPLSSGPGNYRDICQNRRCDIWFYPDLEDQEIRVFVELLQADGYNPLSVMGYMWFLSDKVDPLQFCPAKDDQARSEFCRIVKGKFHPGQLLNWLNLHGIDVDDRPKWLEEILKHCDRELVACGHNGGYWIDHWTYITDLLEAFAGIYPDRVESMLDGSADINWFDEGAHVVAHSNRHNHGDKAQVQFNAVVDVPVSDGPLHPVTVFGKLCALLAVKAVTFDYHCQGIEMEAGRPGWNDALNGLPALFGSSTCEVAELARMAGWLLKHLPEPPDTTFPIEVANFIDEVVSDIESKAYSWTKNVKMREKYRDRFRNDTSGWTRVVSGSQLKRLLVGTEARAGQAIERSIDPKTGLVYTYYINDPVENKPARKADISHGTSVHADSSPGAAIEEFKQRPLPLFLEGQVHYLRLIDSPHHARQIYQAVRKSTLFDASLKMYKLNECLDSCSPEIGRAHTFTRGWFENESIWLHMSYKYLVELLRAGLTEEFFEDAKTMLVPFMDPIVYGRSILENSSFISSSACPDSNARGRGFIARLSGSTAEFIHIWLLLTVGPHPFFLKDERLNFHLKPLLPGQWFTKGQKTVTWHQEQVDIPANCFACALLGQILLVYHNDSRADTFGQSAVRPVKYLLDGKREIEGQSLDSEFAEWVRQRKYDRIDIWLE